MVSVQEATLAPHQPAQRDEWPCLPAAGRLFADLNQAGIRYCHWKSNVRLPEALRGQTDLDLLVDPTRRDQFLRLLQRHDVKPLHPAPGKDYPGVENYLGFDHSSGALYHLHVHEHLILGEQLVKNYILPLHHHFLNSTTRQRQVNIPLPEFELIVYCMRMLLKYRDRDALKDILAIRSPGLSDAILQELAWLQAQTTTATMEQALNRLQNVVDPAIIHDFLQTVARNPRDGRALLRLRSRLRAALRPYRRRSQWRASLTYFRELWLRPKQRMRPRSGGRTLALVGADGAGKSTMGKILQKWLSWKVDTQLIYLGSKQPSRRSRLIYLLFRLLRRSHRTLSHRLHNGNLLVRALARLQQTAHYTHQLSLAHDRRKRHRLAQAQARAGAIVIYDRFPLHPLLDGPKIAHMETYDDAPLARWLASREAAIYQQFAAPDLILHLDVTPEVSLQRKPDHKPQAIAAKHAILRNILAQSPAPVLRIDATQEMEAVIAQLKETIWRTL